MNDPRGVLIIIGGSVNLPTEDYNEDNGENALLESPDILNRFTKHLMGETNRIEIIPAASEIPQKIGDEYIQAFRQLGYENVGVLNIRDRADTRNTEFLDRIQEAEGVLFTGGNQLRLTSILGGTQFSSILFDRYRNEPLVIAGTSAGAMAMSDTMIYGGSSYEALLKGEVHFSPGFGLLNGIIIDTHFVKRGRIGRLFQAVASNPASLGIGLGEDTGLLIKDGGIKESIGSGLVIIVDGYSIRYSNFAHIDQGKPISIENLCVHVMVPGDKYILSERRFVRAES